MYIKKKSEARTAGTSASDHREDNARYAGAVPVVGHEGVAPGVTVGITVIGRDNAVGTNVPHDGLEGLVHDTRPRVRRKSFVVVEVATGGGGVGAARALVRGACWLQQLPDRGVVVVVMVVVVVVVVEGVVNLVDVDPARVGGVPGLLARKLHAH